MFMLTIPKKRYSYHVLFTGPQQGLPNEYIPIIQFDTSSLHGIGPRRAHSSIPYQVASKRHRRRSQRVRSLTSPRISELRRCSYRQASMLPVDTAVGVASTSTMSTREWPEELPQQAAAVREVLATLQGTARHCRCGCDRSAFRREEDSETFEGDRCVGGDVESVGRWVMGIVPSLI